MKKTNLFAQLKKLLILSVLGAWLSFGMNSWAQTSGIPNSNNIDLVMDGPGRKIEKVIMFLGDLSATTSQTQIIKSLDGTQFMVMVSLELSKTQKDRTQILQTYNYANVQVKFLNYPVTSWAQDRILRQEGKVTGVYSDHMKEMLSIYETNAVMLAKNELGLNLSDNVSHIQISQFNGKDPFIIKNQKTIANYLKASASNLFYGDGGDRIILNDYILMGGNSLIEMKKLGQSNSVDSLGVIEAGSGKKLISLDESLEYKGRYAYHLDLYLTPVEERTIIMGSYKMALDMLPGQEDWVNYEEMKNKEKVGLEIKNKLVSLGFKVKEIPLVIDKEGQIISFNNGVFNGRHFLLSSYKFKNENKNFWINKMQQVSEKAFNEERILLHFIAGGENNLPFGGQIRCMVAIVKTSEINSE